MRDEHDENVTSRPPHLRRYGLCLVQFAGGRRTRSRRRAHRCAIAKPPARVREAAAASTPAGAGRDCRIASTASSTRSVHRSSWGDTTRTRNPCASPSIATPGESSTCNPIPNAGGNFDGPRRPTTSSCRTQVDDALEPNSHAAEPALADNAGSAARSYRPRSAAPRASACMSARQPRRACSG